MPSATLPQQGFRALIVVSRPLDLQDLPNVADQWALQDGLRRVNAPARLKILRPPTVEGFRAEILSGYDIVHFDGHGGFGVRCPNCSWLGSQVEKCGRCDALLEGQEAKGYFAFEREDGQLDSLAADEMAEIQEIPATSCGRCRGSSARCSSSASVSRGSMTFFHRRAAQ